MTSSWPTATPLPGVSRKNLIETLRQQHTDAYNLRSRTHGSGPDQLIRYLNWASGAVRMLTNRIRQDDISRLVLTPGYDRLLTLAGWLRAENDPVSVMNGLLDLELNQVLADLDEARTSLEALAARWWYAQAFALPDTSVYIKHEHKLQDLDFAAHLDLAYQVQPVHIFVPIVVIDELDRLKEHDRTRWRASYTLGVIDRLFHATARPEQLRPMVPGAHGPVVMELVFDPPRHSRLPIADDEIVDRALALQALTESPVTVITYDTGQAMRARNAGLTVSKLAVPLPDGEDEPVSRRQKRREAAAGEAAGNGQAAAPGQAVKEGQE